jgi:methylmalonyl-CoA/ethylmalonyl-CoA epimerase
MTGRERGSAASLGAVFDHVAHAAPRITDLLPLYRDVLGGTFLGGEADSEHGYRFVQLQLAEGTKIELLEPLESSTFLDGFLQRHPAGGLHHVTFRVPDLDRAIAAAAAFGYQVFGVDRRRPDWKEAFLHPRVAHGALLQLAEAPPGDTWIVPGQTLDDILAAG